jgi:outer membrane protein OmpA-like peptidoglycan-associated protein
MRSGVAAKLFAACLCCSLVDLVALDFVVGPAALRDDVTANDAQTGPTAASTDATTSPTSTLTSPTPTPTAPPAAASGEPATRPASGRRVVARFDSDSPIADDTDLRTLAASMLADPSAEIVLEGHTDQRGDPERNRMLSLERAKWAQTRLVELGVSSSRIAVVGVGAERPRETDDAAIASNRRVEVRWITGTPPAEIGDR